MIFCEREGCCTCTYCARTVAENGEKDAFSVISYNEWNPYKYIGIKCNFA